MLSAHTPTALIRMAAVASVKKYQRMPSFFSFRGFVR
jgi:hypothetical protein